MFLYLSPTQTKKKGKINTVSKLISFNSLQQLLTRTLCQANRRSSKKWDKLNALKRKRELGECWQMIRCNTSLLFESCKKSQCLSETCRVLVKTCWKTVILSCSDGPNPDGRKIKCMGEKLTIRLNCKAENNNKTELPNIHPKFTKNILNLHNILHEKKNNNKLPYSLRSQGDNLQL